MPQLPEGDEAMKGVSKMSERELRAEVRMWRGQAKEVRRELIPVIDRAQKARRAIEWGLYPDDD